MEIVELSEGYARVEFTDEEIMSAGSVFNAVARRLDPDVNIRIIKPIDYDKSRQLWKVHVRLYRYTVGR